MLRINKEAVENQEVTYSHTVSKNV